MSDKEIKKAGWKQIASRAFVKDVPKRYMQWDCLELEIDFKDQYRITLYTKDNEKDQLFKGKVDNTEDLIKLTNQLRLNE